MGGVPLYDLQWLRMLHGSEEDTFSRVSRETIATSRVAREICTDSHLGKAPLKYIAGPVWSSSLCEGESSSLTTYRSESIIVIMRWTRLAP